MVFEPNPAFSNYVSTASKLSLFLTIYIQILNMNESLVTPFVLYVLQNQDCNLFGLKTVKHVGAIKLSIELAHPYTSKYLHHLVAEVVDDFHSEAAY